ncbi:MAG: sodium:solute symporter family transporter, partial [Cetobacterium sp.]
MLMFLSFIFFTLLVGVLTYYKTKGDKLDTNDGYFLGGRSLTAGFIAGSLMLTNLSPANFAGMSAQSFTHNMSVMGWEVGSGITLVLVAMFLVPRYLKGGLTTIPEFLEDRFDPGVKKFVTYLFLISYVLNGLPPTLYAGALVMSQLFDVSGIFGISYTAGIWLTVWAIGIIGAIYAIFGGLKAVAFSDTLNGIGLIIGGLSV